MRIREHYWAVIDTSNRYMPTLHTTRREAVADLRLAQVLNQEGEFVVKKVDLVEVNGQSKKGATQ